MKTSTVVIIGIVVLLAGVAFVVVAKATAPKPKGPFENLLGSIGGVFSAVGGTVDSFI